MPEKRLFPSMGTDPCRHALRPPGSNPSVNECNRDLLLIETTSIQLAHLTVVAGRAQPSMPGLAEISDFVPGAKA
jgi:hypothetical protein